MTTLVQEKAEPRIAEVPDRSVGSRVTHGLDTLILVALAAFAAWTLWYLAALAGVVPSAFAFWAWVLTLPLVTAVVVGRLRRGLRGIPTSAPWVPLGVAAAFALGALVIVRPDLDDASYVVRSTWIAAHGDVRVGDVIFSGGRWPGMGFQTPYLQSVEALLGWLSRASGISAGTIVYVLVPPVATFLAVWALSMLLRSWRANNPAACLVLAAAFLLTGGATHASWGNLHVARMWQGKVVFLAVVVPLLFALVAGFWRAEERTARRAALAAVGLAGLAGVGLSAAAVFVVPGVLVVGLLPGLVRRRWADAFALFLVGAAPPLACGVVVLMAGETANGTVAQAADRPWVKVLGAGVPVVVTLVAALVAVLGCVLPRLFGTCADVGRWTSLAAVCSAVAIAVPVLYEVAVRVMGTNAIAWRLTWVVPLPALVGLLAGLPRWSRLPTGPVVGVLTAGLLLWGGLPLWSTANGAWLASPPAWKLQSADVAAARWAAEHHGGGRVLAPAGASVALGVVTADVQPVGTRTDYMATYLGRPGTQMDQRLLLQRLADGGGDPADVVAAPAALDELSVSVVCTFPADPLARDVLGGESFRRGLRAGPLSCYTRG